MSPAFISGVEANCPEAHITFDRFHIMKVPGNAMDYEIGRASCRERV